MKIEQGFSSKGTVAAPDLEAQSSSNAVFDSYQAETPLKGSSGISQQTAIVFGCLVSVGAMLTWLFLGLGFVWPVIAILVCAVAFAATEWQRRGVSESYLAVKYPEQELSPDLPPVIHRQ